MDIARACRFISVRGNRLEKERLRCLLTGEAGDPEIFPAERLRNPDDGFPLRLQAGESSSINSTAVARLCLQDLNRLTPELDRQIAGFILSCQNRDGIFVDPYPTLASHLPVWMEYGTFRFAVYYTLFSCLELLKIDRHCRFRLRTSLELLTQWQRQNGAFPGYLHNSWFGTGVLLLLGDRPAETERGLRFLDGIGLRDWEASQLIWALEVLIDGGLGTVHPLIEKWFGWMEEIQNHDGSFTSEDDDRFNPAVTLHALRVFKKLDRNRKGVGETDALSL